MRAAAALRQFWPSFFFLNEAQALVSLRGPSTEQTRAGCPMHQSRPRRSIDAGLRRIGVHAGIQGFPRALDRHGPEPGRKIAEQISFAYTFHRRADGRHFGWAVRGLLWAARSLRVYVH